MTGKNDKPKERKPAEKHSPEPIDVVDGIPDRSGGAGIWRRVIIGVIFAGWVAFLVYCVMAGNP